jgi:hypothetical protein
VRYSASCELKENDETESKDPFLGKPGITWYPWLHKSCVWFWSFPLRPKCYIGSLRPVFCLMSGLSCAFFSGVTCLATLPSSTDWSSAVDVLPSQPRNSVVLLLVTSLTKILLARLLSLVGRLGSLSSSVFLNFPIMEYTALGNFQHKKLFYTFPQIWLITILSDLGTVPCTSW